MAAMNMVSAGGFSGVSFHSRRCPQGVASVLCKKTPIFGFRRSKLDHLKVVFGHIVSLPFSLIRKIVKWNNFAINSSESLKSSHVLRQWHQSDLLDKLLTVMA